MDTRFRLMEHSGVYCLFSCWQFNLCSATIMLFVGLIGFIGTMANTLLSMGILCIPLAFWLVRCCLWDWLHSIGSVVHQALLASRLKCILSEFAWNFADWIYLLEWAETLLRVGWIVVHGLAASGSSCISLLEHVAEWVHCFKLAETFSRVGWFALYGCLVKIHGALILLIFDCIYLAMIPALQWYFFASLCPNNSGISCILWLSGCNPCNLWVLLLQLVTKLGSSYRTWGPCAPMPSKRAAFWHKALAFQVLM